MCSLTEVDLYCMLYSMLLANTFVSYGRFEWNTNNSYKVFSGNQRAKDGTNTQSFTFAFVDELERGKRKLNKKKTRN